MEHSIRFDSFSISYHFLSGWYREGKMEMGRKEKSGRNCNHTEWSRSAVAIKIVSVWPWKAAIFRVGRGEERIVSDEGSGVWCADSPPLGGDQPSGKLWGFMWASVAQPATVTLTRVHCVQRQHVSPPHSPTSILFPSAPSSVTAGLCFSMISRLIGGEISSLMVVVEWRITSQSPATLHIDYNIMA